MVTRCDTQVIVIMSSCIIAALACTVRGDTNGCRAVDDGPSTTGCGSRFASARSRRAHAADMEASTSVAKCRKVSVQWRKEAARSGSVEGV